MGKHIQYTNGDIINGLVFKNKTSRTGKENLWMGIFICRCGREFEAIISFIKKRSVTECHLCAAETKRNAIVNRNTKHGNSIRGQRNRLYLVWANMKARCTNEKLVSYKNYGGRGIRVCERWQNFCNFLIDMGQAPSNSYTLDRIDNDGNYEPSNCRWATRAQQARNTSRKMMITYNDETLHICEWGERFGLSRDILRSRIIANNWDLEKAFTTPVRKR